jgi:N-glycosylase/DNA lyase
VAAVAPHLPGMRILRQDPLECLVSFICSSNNNIMRITLMLGKLREAYGDAIVVESEAVRAAGVLRLFRFPTLAQLQRASEEELRALGFGYRAKYIVSTVSKLASREGARWLASLRAEPQSAEGDARVLTALLELDGVGPKVADCVALFSLDRRRVVPVDTHVWQIACRDFDRSLTEARSLTPAVYLRVGELFRQRYGPFAGWAHSLLFAAELPQFRVLLPDATQHEMQLFSQLERGRKSELRAAKAQRKADKAGTAGRGQQPAKTDEKARKTGRAEPAAKAASTAAKAASRTTARVDASSKRASKKRKAHV